MHSFITELYLNAMVSTQSIVSLMLADFSNNFQIRVEAQYRYRFLMRMQTLIFLMFLDFENGLYEVVLQHFCNMLNI